MEEMLYNEELGRSLIVTNVMTVYDGMVKVPNCILERPFPCHILEIQYLNDYLYHIHCGRLGQIYKRYLYFYQEPDEIFEKGYLSYVVRKYNDSEKHIYSLSATEALSRYIRLFNLDLEKILKSGDERNLYQFTHIAGFHHWDFSRVFIK